MEIDNLSFNDAYDLAVIAAKNQSKIERQNLIQDYIYGICFNGTKYNFFICKEEKLLPKNCLIIKKSKMQSLFLGIVLDITMKQKIGP